MPFFCFSLKVHVFYDDSFKARFGAAVITRINAIFSIVKTIYSDDSLTTKIVPDVVQISHQSGKTWTATGDTLSYVYSNVETPLVSNKYFKYDILCYLVKLYLQRA